MGVHFSLESTTSMYVHPHLVHFRRRSPLASGMIQNTHQYRKASFSHLLLKKATL
jgi:hypothetical protein